MTDKGRLMVYVCAVHSPRPGCQKRSCRWRLCRQNRRLWFDAQHSEHWVLPQDNRREFWLTDRPRLSSSLYSSLNSAYKALHIALLTRRWILDSANLHRPLDRLQHTFLHFVTRWPWTLTLGMNEWMNEWCFLLTSDKKLTKSQFSPTHASTKRKITDELKHNAGWYEVREGSPVEVQWAVGG